MSEQKALLKMQEADKALSAALKRHESAEKAGVFGPRDKALEQAIFNHGFAIGFYHAITDKEGL